MSASERQLGMSEKCTLVITRGGKKKKLRTLQDKLQKLLNLTTS